MDVPCDQSLFAKRGKRVHVAPYHKLPPFPIQEDEGLRLPELLWKETPEAELAPPRPRKLAREQPRNTVPYVTPSENDNTQDESDADSDDSASNAGPNGINEVPTDLIRVPSAENTGPPHYAAIIAQYECSHCVHAVQDKTPRTYQAAMIHRAICAYNPTPDPAAIPEGLIPKRRVLSTPDGNLSERFLCLYCVNEGGSTVDRELAMALIHRAECNKNPHRESFIPTGLYPIRTILYCDTQGAPVYKDEDTFCCSYCIHAKQGTTKRDLGEALIHRTACQNNPHREHKNVLEGLIPKQSFTVCDDDGNSTAVHGNIGGEDCFKCLYCVSDGNDSRHRNLALALQHRAMCIWNPDRLNGLCDPEVIPLGPPREPPGDPPKKKKKKKIIERRQTTPQDPMDPSMGISLASTSNKRQRTESPLYTPRKKQKKDIDLSFTGSEEHRGVIHRQRLRRLVGEGRPQWTYLEGIIPIDEHWNGIQLTVSESEARYICEYCLGNTDNTPRSLKEASLRRIACPRNPDKAIHSGQHKRLYGEESQKWEGHKVTGVEYLDVDTDKGIRVACRACKRFKPTEYRTWKQNSGFRCHWQFCIYNCDNIDPARASRIFPEMSLGSPFKSPRPSNAMRRSTISGETDLSMSPTVSFRPTDIMFSERKPVRAGENISIPVTPPAAMYSPERSRQFQPAQASPSLFLTPRVSPHKEVVEETYQTEMEHNLGNGFGPEEVKVRGMDILAAPDVLD